LRRSSSEFIRFWERGIGDLGLVAQLFREVKRQFSRLFNRFRKKPGENVDETERCQSGNGEVEAKRL